MARANHARCLHCGVRLPLYRQLTEAGFCSTQHRKAFQDDQARLAVARLIENQQMLSRVHDDHHELPFPAEPEPVEVEPPALQSADDAASPSADPPDFVSFERGDAPDVAELMDWPVEPPPEKPASLAAVKDITAAVEGRHPVAPSKPDHLYTLSPRRVSMSTPDLVAADPIAFDFTGETILPAPETAAPAKAGFGDAGEVELQIDAVAGDAVRTDAPVDALAAPAPPLAWPVSQQRLPFVSELRVSAGLRNPGRIDAVDSTEEPIGGLHAMAPRCATWLPLPDASRAQTFVPAIAEMCALPEQDAVGSTTSEFAPHVVEPETLSLATETCAAWLPVSTGNVAEYQPEIAGLQCLPDQAAIGLFAFALQPRAAEIPAPQSPDLPRIGQSLSGATLPALHLEFAENSAQLLKPQAAGGNAGCMLPEPSGPAQLKPVECRPQPSTEFCAARLTIHPQVPVGLANAVEPPLTWGIKGGDFTCLERKDNHACPVLPCPALPSSLATAAKVPVPLGSGVTMPHTRGLVMRAMRSHDIFPGSRIFPRETFELQRLAGEEFLTLAARVRPAAVAASARSTARWLKAASRGIQLMAIAVPVLLFVAFRPPPKVEPTSGVPGPVGRFVNSRLTAVKSAIQSRAGLEYLDDFRAGLDNWEGQNDLTRSWSYDQAGFVKPGPLAIYRPSVGMSDYQFEFLGQIDKRAIGWVFRAQDLNNYQVAKLVMLKSGPLPTVGLERYSVIRGKSGRRIQVALPLNVHQDTVYRVRMEVRGADYALYVQDQLVHFWSDPRLLSGGVGFFSGPGEQSRIRWMQVSHQYDAIGRLCAYFAPMAIATYNIDSSMGAGSK